MAGPDVTLPMRVGGMAAPGHPDLGRLLMPTIFLNFRNGDSDWAAKALRIVLEQRFGRDQVFLSHDSIPIGCTVA